MADISTEIAAIQSATTGNEMRSPMVDALNKLNSGSLPAVTSSDAGKVMKVNSSGTWEMGDVPTPAPNLQNKTITLNGTYTADSAYDGLGTVVVNVQSSDLPSANGVSF